MVAISIIQSLSKTTELLVFNTLSIYINKVLYTFNPMSLIPTYILTTASSDNVNQLTTAFFIVACIGKSAQFGLHL